MAVINEIISLLHGFWDHRRALHVFVKFGGSEILAKLIDVDNTFNQIKLRKELGKIQDRLQEQVDDKILVEVPDDAPKDVMALITRRQEAYRERDQLFAQLMHINDAHERGQSALRQLELDDEINEIWEKIHVYKSTGALPMERPHIEITIDDPLELMKVFSRNKNYIYKYRIRESNTEKIKETLALRIAENIEITKILNLNG